MMACQDVDPVRSRRHSVMRVRACLLHSQYSNEKLCTNFLSGLKQLTLTSTSPRVKNEICTRSRSKIVLKSIKINYGSATAYNYMNVIEMMDYIYRDIYQRDCNEQVLSPRTMNSIDMSTQET